MKITIDTDKMMSGLKNLFHRPTLNDKIDEIYRQLREMKAERERKEAETAKED